MKKLYYRPNQQAFVTCIADDMAVHYAFLLNEQNELVTSNELVILAARVLVKEGKLEPFIVVYKDKEYEIDKNGRFSNGYPDSYFDDLLERLL